MYTTDGGVSAAGPDWREVPVPGVGWFSGEFVAAAQPEEVVVTGLQYCTSTSGGGSFNCAAPVDPVFDGGVALLEQYPGKGFGLGLTGGGQISTPLSGWVHRSTDGGKTWPGGRVLSAPWPVRFVGWFGTPAVGVAAGGDYDSGVGGVYTSYDDGATWKLEIDTGVEMAACAGTSRDFRAGAEAGAGAGAEAEARDEAKAQSTGRPGEPQRRQRRQGAGGVGRSGGGGGSVYVTCVGSARGKTSVVVSQAFEIGGGGGKEE